MFLLRGDREDPGCWGGSAEEGGLLAYLQRQLLRSKDLVLRYSGSQGLAFPKASHGRRFLEKVNTRRMLDGQGRELLRGLPEDGAEALAAIADLVTDPTQRAGVIIEDVDIARPQEDGAPLGEGGAPGLWDLQCWAEDEGLDRSQNTVVLLPALRAGLPPDPRLKALRLPLHDIVELGALRPPALGSIGARQYPDWVEEFKLRFESSEVSMFLLHGNVRDLVAWDDEHGNTSYIPLRSFLERFLARTQQPVLYYNCSEGFKFPKGHRQKFLTQVNARRTLNGERELLGLQRSPVEALPIIEELVTLEEGQAGVIIDYVETVVPMGDLAFMVDGDKANLVALQRWAGDQTLQASNTVVLLMTESLSDIHRRLLSNPRLAAVQVPLPSTAERLAFIRSLSDRKVRMEMSEEILAEVTAGLSITQIQGLFFHAEKAGLTITYAAVSARKKSIIEQECHGLVEFVAPRHDFSHVGGLERIKTDLLQMASAIKKGQRNRVPMGVIFVGPMGTGKTYVAEAFAAESGLTCLKFKNFREKWVGSTEGNLEKILNVVQALGYVLLIIDEADRSLSSGTDGDGGTSSRVIARLKEFMSDTEHRGRVVTLMMTNRPDKVDSDLKRPGRFDMKIPFFFPEEAEERHAILEALLRKNRMALEEGVELSGAVEGTDGYSGAELEAVLLAAARLAGMEDRERIAPQDLEQAVSDVIPSRDTRMLEFMEMLAVFEASARRMLPLRFQELGTEEVHSRLDQLRAMLGARLR